MLNEPVRGERKSSASPFSFLLPFPPTPEILHTMSLFFHKHIASSITYTCLRIITIAVPPPSFTFTFSSLSSTPACYSQPNHNNVISEFLLNECGFCPSELSKVLRGHAPLLRTKSAHTAKEAVQFLRDSGFTQDHLKKIIIGCSSILTYKVEGQLKLKMEFIRTLGIADQELLNLLCRQPRLLTYSLENAIRPTIFCLESLFGSKTNLAKALRRAPSLISLNIEKQFTPKLDLLKHYGSIEGELLSLLISQKPGILSLMSTETLKLKIEYVENMGVLRGSKSFVYALISVVQNSPENLERKMKHLENLGLLKEELHELIKKFPSILGLSTNKMHENMNFLIHTSRLPPKIVVTYPILLSYSVEKRLKPRYEVFKALCSMKQTNHLPSLVSMFQATEQKFLKKFVECGPEASLLKGIYNGKSADLTII